MFRFRVILIVKNYLKGRGRLTLKSQKKIVSSGVSDRFECVEVLILLLITY